MKYAAAFRATGLTQALISFDNAWEYYNGKTETILGRALRDGRRDKVFLMTKVCTHGRSGKLAMQMLEESLRRFQTDHLDLWQIHGIVYDNDPELAYAKGGVLEAFDRAKKEGKVRFVGFTGHKDPAFHLKMLELGYPFDSVQMPLNPFDANFRSFEKQVLPEVNRRGMAALGMKSMGGTAWGIKAGVVQAEEMLRYAMSLPVATTICGMDSLDVLHQNLQRRARLSTDDRSEMEALRARCAADSGRRPLRAVQGVAAVRQPDDPDAARLPPRSHPKRSHRDVGEGRRPMVGARDNARDFREVKMADQRRQNEQAQATPEIERRCFLQAGLASAGTELAASVLPSQVVSAPVPPQMTNTGADQIPRKPLGKTGEQVSIIGLGGYHLGTVQSRDQAVRLVHEAVDAGVTFFDNAWEYNDHRSEEWMGRGLQGRRDKVFLMTKVCTHGRDKKVAMQQLEESLKRLRTDHLDLWQIHEVIYENDPDLHFAKGGVVEALDEAKKQGKVRFVGFTGHKSPAIHLKMLAHDYPFDTVQMPLNCFDATYRSFEQQVLPELERRGIAALGMKSLGGDGQPILYGVVRAEEALRYAMSLPVATTICGIDSLDVLRQNLGIARGFKPMTRKRCRRSVSDADLLRGDGHLELFKTTKKYDGAVGREQHGYPPPEQLPL